MLTVGFIGNGKSANRYHLPFVLQRKDKIKVKTIVTRNLENKTWKRIDGINYGTFTGSLDDSNFV